MSFFYVACSSKSMWAIGSWAYKVEGEMETQREHLQPEQYGGCMVSLSWVRPQVVQPSSSSALLTLQQGCARSGDGSRILVLPYIQSWLIQN